MVKSGERVMALCCGHDRNLGFGQRLIGEAVERNGERSEMKKISSRWSLGKVNMIVPGFNHKVFQLSFGIQNCKGKKPNIVIASLD